jgi:hypothetical protein
MFCLGVPPGDSVRRWSDIAGLTCPGGPGQVSLRRLRRTVQVLIRREPAQNTDQTHEQVYVLRDPATRPDSPVNLFPRLRTLAMHPPVPYLSTNPVA